MNTSKLESAIIRSGKTKVEIAELCGVTRQTINAIIRGGEIGVSKVERLAQVLDVPVGYFFDEADADGARRVEPTELEREVSHLKERLADKEKQLADKERLIQILMQK